MLFPRSDVLRVVINAYIARRQPRWSSLYIEHLAWITKKFTWQTYEGESDKKAKCQQFETQFLKPLEENPAQIDKWIEMCCHLNKLVNTGNTTINRYFNFIRRVVLLHFANHFEFKSALEKLLAQQNSAAHADLQQLQRDLSSLDSGKTTAELTDFFVNDIRKYDASVKFASYEEFLAAAVIDVSAKQEKVAEKAEQKSEPAKPLATSATVKKKLYVEALLDGMNKRVQELQKKLEKPAEPAATVPVKATSPWDIDLSDKQSKADKDEKATAPVRRPAPIATNFEEPKMRRRNRSRRKHVEEYVPASVRPR